jgi:hypothetical protein
MGYWYRRILECALPIWNKSVLHCGRVVSAACSVVGGYDALRKIQTSNLGKNPLNYFMSTIPLLVCKMLVIIMKCNKTIENEKAMLLLHSILLHSVAAICTTVIHKLCPIGIMHQRTSIPHYN